MMMESEQEDDNLSRGGEDPQFAIRINAIVNRISESLNIPQRFNELIDFANKHPFVAVFALAAIVLGIFPTMLFICFVSGTLFVAFFGFLFLEGTLLTFAAIALMAVLVGIAVCAFGISGVAAGIWVMLGGIYQYVSDSKKATEQKSKHDDEKNVPRRK